MIGEEALPQGTVFKYNMCIIAGDIRGNDEMNRYKGEMSN